MKYALITGVCGGLGDATATLLVKNGYQVFGIDLMLPKEPKDGITYYSADITSREQVEKAKDEILKVTDHLDVIINVAGIMMMGSLIEEHAEKLIKMMNINVGGMALMNEIFAEMIIKGKGRIINFSSEYGTYTTVPFNAFYTITKHAVESYSDGLRRELKYIHIPVITIRPGAFKTNMEKGASSNFERICANTTHYKKSLTKMSSLLGDETKSAKDPSILANVVLKAVTAKKPKRVYKVNHDFEVKFLSILPEGLIDKIFYMMFKQD